MSKAVLTIKFIEAVKPNPKGRVEIPDAGLPGMYLIVQSSGAKAWAYRYRYDGKPKKLTIGSVLMKREAGEVDGDLPFGIPMTLAEARRATRRAMQMVAEGLDPSANKKQTKERQKAEPRDDTNTVEHHGKEFIKRYAKPNNRSWAEKERQFTAEINPAWGSRDISTITKRNVIELMDAIIDRGSPVTANRVLATLKTFFGWLVERDIIPASPTVSIKKPSAEKSRDRILTDDELRRVWNEAAKFEYPFGSFWQILLLTGQRRNEVAGMQADELTLDGLKPEWIIPADRTKNGKPHVVALSNSVVEIIKSLPEAGKSGLLFSTTGETSISGFSRSKGRLDDALTAKMKKEVIEAGGDPESVALTPWTLHDLRRTMASGMARIGISLPVIERCLNHVSGSFGGIVGVYQRHEYRDETRAAFNAWASLVDDIVHGRDETNVIPMKKPN